MARQTLCSFEEYEKKIEPYLDKCFAQQWYHNDDFVNMLINRDAFDNRRLSFIKHILVPILDELYPNLYHITLDFWYEYDISQLHFDDYGRINVILRYPKVTVSDGKHSTTLTNHFQKIVFRNIDDRIEYYNFSAMTVNPTMQQFIKGYMHSHISDTNYSYQDFRSFCLGSGDILTIANEIKNYQIENAPIDFSTEEYLYGLFQMFFINTTTIAEHESRAGRPHKFIKDLKLGERGNSGIIETYSYTDAYDREKILLPVNWQFQNGLYKVIDDEMLEKHCLIHDNEDNYHNSHLVYKDSLGNYYSKTRHSPTTHNISWSFKFKDEEYPFGLAEGEEEINPTVYIHPKLKKYVKQKLEDKANQQAINNYYQKA